MIGLTGEEQVALDDLVRRLNDHEHDRGAVLHDGERGCWRCYVEVRQWEAKYGRRLRWKGAA